jgi:hypothetical protein
MRKEFPMMIRTHFHYIQGMVTDGPLRAVLEART